MKREKFKDDDWFFFFYIEYYILFLMLTGPDQFFGWIHMLKLKTYGLRILNPGERPPYPIIIERPTIKDVL